MRTVSGIPQNKTVRITIQLVDTFTSAAFDHDSIDFSPRLQVVRHRRRP
jgi:hypothetical protein